MNIALILAGGSGNRVGSKVPKQYMEVNGKPVISYCLDTFLAHKMIDAIQIVADKKWHDFIQKQLFCDSLNEELIKEEFLSGLKSDVNKQDKFRGYSMPGECRQISILNGLGDIKDYASDNDFVIIHDAARPLLTSKQISNCFQTIGNHDGVLPVLTMKDTVYFSSDGMKISTLLDRNHIYAGQAPEVFVLGAYYEANKRLLPDKILQINGSTEPAILAGMDVILIPGDESNFKITTREDLDRFQKILDSCI